MTTSPLQAIGWVIHIGLYLDGHDYRSPLLPSSRLRRARPDAVTTLPHLAQGIGSPHMNLTINVNTGIPLTLFRHINGHIIHLLCRGRRPVYCRLN